jgi:ATP adenylyltransferase
MVTGNGAFLVQRLWTPWRMTYVAGEARPDCVFCTARDAEDDARMLILQRGEHCFAILNLYPYNSGHLMVVPYQHAASIEDVDSATRAEMFDLASLTVEAAREVLNCSGFNLGMNIGENAGAGVADHIHLHVVPRWVGDANFMPILGDTMVMPELLPVTYARMRAGLEGMIARRERGAVCQAGAVVVLPERQEVVLRRARNGDIVLPKGHIEAGEAPLAAAIREVREETGVEAQVVGWAGSDTFEMPIGDGTTQVRYVAYFLATGAVTADTEAHLGADTLLVPIEEAAELISVPALARQVRALTPTLVALLEASR